MVNLRSFRLVCPDSDISLVETLLHDQGYRFSPEPFSPFARRLLAEPAPLGKSLAAVFGYVYIQDRSSMLPPVVLNPPKGASVLDMCASPGSKTGFLGQLVGEEGFVLGNEPSQSRLATLRQNLLSLNLLQCGTASYPGELFPRPDSAHMAGGPAENALRRPGWEYIQLDPPCSGWGTAGKNPQVLSLWQGDKIKPLIDLQRKLLARAKQLLAPGGVLVYSTCTTNPDENERQVQYACDELGFQFTPVTPPGGFEFSPGTSPRFAAALYLETSAGQQGFFVAQLTNSCGFDRQGSQKEEEVRVDRTGKIPESSLAGMLARGGELLHPEDLDATGFCGRLLPSGDTFAYKGYVFFIPRGARELLPETASWRPFVLGKVHKDGTIRLFPGLRRCLPRIDEAPQAGSAVLNVEEPVVLEQLLSGQSIQVATGGKPLGLYYRELPLCWMTVKGNRGMLPAL